LTAEEIREFANACGFELSGVAEAVPASDRTRYREWAAAGWAGAFLGFALVYGPPLCRPRESSGAIAS